MTTTQTQQRINHQIRITPIRVIDEDGAQLGVIPTAQAMSIAQEKGLDLVEVSPQARPPVCKIMDFSRFKYQQQKAQKEAKKKQKVVELREIQFTPNVGDADLEVKVNKIKEFLGEGAKVKLVVRFKGREMAHPEMGAELLKTVIGQVGAIAKIEIPPTMEGRFLRTILTPSQVKNDG